MRGQWIGNFSGQNQGLLMLNVDDRGAHFEGIAYLNVTNKHLPSTAATFVTANKERSFEFRTTNVWPINPINGVVDSWENVKQFYDPQIRISGWADIKGIWDDDFIELSWKTELGRVNTNGHGCEILRTWNSPTPSIVKSNDVCRHHAAT